MNLATPARPVVAVLVTGVPPGPVHVAVTTALRTGWLRPPSMATPAVKLQLLRPALEVIVILLTCRPGRSQPSSTPSPSPSESAWSGLGVVGQWSTS